MGDRVVSRFIKKLQKNMPKEQTLLKDFLSRVKEELDDHLETINANTSEIEINYEYMCELEQKIDKLNEKIDEMMLYLGLKEKKIQAEPIKVSLREQEVFLILYTAEKGATITDICRRLGVPMDSVNKSLGVLAAKGVPVVKRVTANGELFCLDPRFRNLQAKENVLQISEVVARQFA